MSEEIKPQIMALSKEELIIRTFFNDSIIGPKIKASMKPDMFIDPINRQLVAMIPRFEKAFGHTPTAQELIIALSGHAPSAAVVERIATVCNSNIGPMHQDAVIHMVEGYFQERMAEQIIVNAAEAIHDKHVEDIRSLLPSLRDAVNFSLHTELGINLRNDAGEALSLLKQRKECIPSGINEIRYYTGKRNADGSTTGGGYYRKTLTLYAGQPNVGKSLVLCSEAAYAYLQGYNVLYISLELSEDYVWQRLCSNICDVPFYSTLDLTDEECVAKIDAACGAHNRTDENGNPIKGELQIRRLKSTTTPDEIESLVDMFEIAFGKLDLLVIDYIGIMKPSVNSRNERSMYLDGVAKAEQIRDMLIERNIAGVSAVQFNRSGYHNLNAGIESVSGSSGYSETSDVMISIVSDSVLRDCGMFGNVIMKIDLDPMRLLYKPVVTSKKCDGSVLHRMNWQIIRSNVLKHLLKKILVAEDCKKLDKLDGQRQNRVNQPRKQNQLKMKHRSIRMVEWTLVASKI